MLSLLCLSTALVALPAAAQVAVTSGSGAPAKLDLPAPDLSHEVQNYNTQVGWPDGAAPTAPAGFTVTRFAEELDGPRWLYQLPNGDVLVAEAATAPKPPKDEEERKKQELQKQSGTVKESANRITLLRDTDGDGTPETKSVLLKDLNQPFGMALIGERLYVANTDGVMAFPYKTGATEITEAGEKILDLPAGGYNNHWTRNLLASEDGSTLFVSVGSASNVAEYGLAEETRRANILAVDPDGKNERIYAAGLRNPVGMDFLPGTSTLWTAVNERDMIGDALVPDYITSVKQDGFYGWPYSYYGKTPDPRIADKAKPGLIDTSITPDFAVGAHTASLGLAFYEGTSFPEKYRGGAFVGQRGSWNRSDFSGYRVAFVPFEGGKPSGAIEDFLTGFMPDPAKGETYGRPVGVLSAADGALLVADDAGGIVWRVVPAKE
ncbi:MULTISPECIES: PQQ-dependent sugar dehydrogenase [unclassified Aureimonas]|uniref:PQQ-dependent sugar dehydrogenase n=1 Tax=unclassified Aureimonas TaxID=2615206 RepID=UPI000701BE4E|nr:MULTISPECIES: sorbosone dehydrogenase family protein [unclassified Aureimonas]KQT66014.1 L-sorbosone dehydrogenase [Aureimonas sp. Leaf427]KQT73372.1 L-sorbosone dehydrogenase [Aureimonas sp. Leaf460]